MKMNKMALVLAAMGLVSTASADVLWSAGDGTQVSTGGYWFGYDDASDGGKSTWSCDGSVMAKGAEFGPCMVNDKVEVTFNITADVPNGQYDPFGFAGIGFNLGADDGVSKEQVDLSGYAGLSIDYVASATIKLQVVSDEKALAYDVHFKGLSKSAPSKSFVWSDFKQEGWGTKGDLMVNKLTEIKFQAHSSNIVGSATFSISEIRLDGISNPVFGGETGVNFKYNLVGENLVFNGLSEAMNVEVFNLQGQLVANGEVSSSANSISLEGLKNASYVVRTTQGQFLISIAD